jgi:ribonuclease HII
LLGGPEWANMVPMILGIDEAGRGPVLGPLVVAGVVLRPQRASALTRRGVADSKVFGAGTNARRRRAELAGHVRRLAEDVRIEVYHHEEVDRYASRGLLNELERRAAQTIIEAMPTVKRIVADGERLFGSLRHRFPHLEAYNGGESVHVAVAAASIIAKDQRDRLFEEIAGRYKDEFGELRGGGYINPATEDFLRRFHERYGKLPPETRRSWRWKLLSELEPSRLPLFDGADGESP